MFISYITFKVIYHLLCALCHFDQHDTSLLQYIHQVTSHLRSSLPWYIWRANIVVVVTKDFFSFEDWFDASDAAAESESRMRHPTVLGIQSRIRRNDAVHLKHQLLYEFVIVINKFTIIITLCVFIKLLLTHYHWG